MAKKVAQPVRTIPLQPRPKSAPVAGNVKASPARVSAPPAKAATPPAKPVAAPAPAANTPARRRTGPPAPLTADGKADALKSALEAVAPGLYQVHVQMAGIFGKRIRDDINWNLSVGRKMKDIKEKFADKGINALSKSLGVSRDFLGGAIQVATEFTEADIQALLSKPLAEGRQLSWSHIVQLSRVEDPDRRKQITETLVNEGLSVDSLQEKTKHLVGKRSQGGRGFAMPKGLDNAVHGLNAIAGKLNRYTVAWQGRFKELLEATPIEKITPQTISDMQATADELKSVSDVADQQADAIKTTIRQLTRQMQESKDDDVAVAAFNKANPETNTLGNRIRAARSAATAAPARAVAVED